MSSYYKIHVAFIFYKGEINNMGKQKVFISYSQKDVERVSLFAGLIAKKGYDVWMDVKSIDLGEYIISKIADALSNADIYMLFLSQNSIKSSWVNAELNIALTRNIEYNKPRVIPILLDDCTVPAALTGQLYLDARKSVQDALSQLNDDHQTSEDTSLKFSFKAPILTEVAFVLSEKTDFSIGPLYTDFSKDDLIINRENKMRFLREKANGILMNFVSLSDFDLQSSIPKYKNGIYEEYIDQVPGDLTSSISEKITAKVIIYDPDSKKLDNLIKSKLKKLSVSSLTYVFLLPFPKADQDKNCMQRIQDNYSIISYNFEDGATIEFDSGFFVSIKCTSEQVKIKIQAEYDFTFSEKAIKFSPYNFISWLTK